MKMSRQKLLGALRGLQQERGLLVRRLSRDREMAWGSVSVVRRKCGNPRCRCADGLGHPQTLFLFKDEKKGCRICKLVRRADERRMLKAGENYREFRAGIRRLRAIDSEETRILVAIAGGEAIRYE